MAQQTMPDATNVKIWAKATLRTALNQTLYFKKFMGKANDENSILYYKPELEASAGKTINYDLLKDMTGDGVTGDNRLKGNEEQLIYVPTDIKIDQLRNGHTATAMVQKDTVHDFWTDAKKVLSRWFAVKFDTYMFRYLCGDKTINFAGNQGTVADSDHYIMAGDVTKTGAIETDEASLSDNDQFTLEMIDYAIELAKTDENPIVPVMIDGDEYYVCVLHPFSVTDMKLNLGGSTSADWQEIQRNANVRDGKKNPIFSGALGIYNKTIIFESKYIHSPITNVRRNLFLGAQAGAVAFGNAYKKKAQKTMGTDNLMSWAEDNDDYGNEEGISVGSVFGIKKNIFDSKDHGVITMPSWAAKKR